VDDLRTCNSVLPLVRSYLNNGHQPKHRDFRKVRFCCKSRFAKIVKILGAAGAFFSYGSEGPHRRTLNSQAISAARLRLYESSVALHSKNSPKIRTDATFDFCNKICHERKSPK
jgi:hypothetical protein